MTAGRIGRIDPFLLVEIGRMNRLEGEKRSSAE
jgi:hypothetical protein